MRGVKHRVSRKSGFFVVLALFAWLFLVLVILPRRRHEGALAVGARAGEQDLTGVEEPTTHPPDEPTPLVDDAELARDGSQVLASSGSTRAEHGLADPTASALTAVPNTSADDLEAQPDVQSAFNQRDGALHALREHEQTTPDPPSLDRSPDVRDELLRRLLDALEAHDSDFGSSLDPKPVASRQAATRAVEAHSPQLGVRAYLGAFWRFRWLIPLAVCAAILVPLLMLYRPHWPPVLDARATVAYVTKTQLLVDSPTGPFVRTETRSSVSPVKPVKPVMPGSETTAQSGSSLSSDKKSLVDAANLFPLLIESDEVVSLRRKLIGNVPGSVHATALFANQGANRFRPSVLPVMQIIAVAPDPKGALRLGQGTARAFKIWLAREQNRTNVPRDELIVVRQLRGPSIAEPTGGAGYGLPILAGLAAFGAFVGLAVALDRAFPRVRAGKPSLSSVETVRAAEAGTAEPQASSGEAPYSDSLQRISETLREVRAGSRPG
jgi:hypothetical protein